MDRPGAIGDGTRRAAWLPLALVALGHAILLALLWSARSEPPPAPPAGIEFIASADAPPPDALPPPVARDPVSIDAAAPVIDIAAAPGASVAGGCDIGAALARAFSAGAPAAALAGIPRAQRSVAQAVTLWNGAWVGDGDRAREAARGHVRAVIAAAPDRCRDAPLKGARLVVVPDPAGVTVLAFGAEAWAWADLLAERR